MNSANDKPRKALGKGLSALLPGRGQPGQPQPPPLPPPWQPSLERCRSA